MFNSLNIAKMKRMHSVTEKASSETNKYLERMHLKVVVNFECMKCKKLHESFLKAIECTKSHEIVDNGNTTTE
jgi:hypothetical protein